MNLKEALQQRYIAHVLATPSGRAHVLNQVADAESNGESAVFDRAIAFVDDPALQRMITKHRDDEVRHAAMFRACRDRFGHDGSPAPAHLRIIDRIDRELGHVLDSPIRGRDDVMRMFLLLQVIEERALTMFPAFEAAFASIDAETSRTFGEVAADERRHLKYCHAIAKRYAPSERAHDTALVELRRIEERCFQANARENMAYNFDRGHTDLRPFQQAVWTGTARLAQALGTRRRGRFDAPAFAA